MNAEYDRSALPVDGREGLVLFFTVGGQTFGIRLTDVNHIQPFVRGEGDERGRNAIMVEAVTAGGEKVPAIDLAGFLGIAVSEKGDDCILILFREGKERFGLLADEVQTIVRGQQVREMAWPKLLGEEGARVFGGFFSRDDRLILALNPDYIWILAAPAKKI